MNLYNWVEGEVFADHKIFALVRSEAETEAEAEAARVTIFFSLVFYSTKVFFPSLISTSLPLCLSCDPVLIADYDSTMNKNWTETIPNTCR